MCYYRCLYKIWSFSLHCFVSKFIRWSYALYRRYYTQVYNQCLTQRFLLSTSGHIRSPAGENSSRREKIYHCLSKWYAPRVLTLNCVNACLARAAAFPPFDLPRQSRFSDNTYKERQNYIDFDEKKKNNRDMWNIFWINHFKKMCF